MQYCKEIKKRKEYVLVVCGGGVTGVAAAVSAARHGIKTALIEERGCLGGVATGCGVHFLLGGRKYNPETGKMDRKIGGIFDELTDRLIADGGALEPDDVDLSRNYFGWYPRMAAGIPLNNEKMKIMLENMCMEAGVDIHYFTRIVDTIREADRIKHILAHDKSGFFVLDAPLFIDATGDADIAFQAGCATLKGRASDGLTTPSSLEMILEHVNRDELVEYQNLHNSPKLVEIVKQLKARGEWPFIFDIIVSMQLTEPDVFLVNTVRQIRIDGTDGAHLTRGMIEGRRENMKLFELLKKHFPGFAASRIRYISDFIGIRESRRIVGQYTVTVKDALEGRRFDDCIAGTTYNWDLPDPEKPSVDPMLGRGSHPDANMKQDVIRIPYRAMLPQELKNLIVTGRCISVDREVLGPARIMGPCMGMGHAAGLASVLASGNGWSYSTIDVRKLRHLLVEENSLLPE
ncbi:MAG: FAD-dependent oxidoreductase [Lentisphaerota bacterium]